MAAIDKIYVNSWDEYIQFKKWCEEQPPLFDKYNKIVRLTNYLYQYKEKWESCHPIFNAPYYIDAYVIRNCPFDFIQKELMINYGHCHRDGTMTINELEEFDDYIRIKEGNLYNTPFTFCKYVVGKHFRCTKHPKELYNRPFEIKSWFVDIETPNELPSMWYHESSNTWDFCDEFVESDGSSSTAHVKTIKALKRLMIKWKLPIGAIVRATGRYTFDDYEFIITK